MAAFDAAGSGPSTSATSLTWSHTCAGANRILFVGFLSNGTVTGVTYNGVAMTQVGSSVFTPSPTYTPTPSPTPEAWAKRADAVRMQMRVALGIWPEPTRTPLNAVIHGRVEGGDYTVEKVFFESMPGFFVTGNLYRPPGTARPRVLGDRR